MQTAFAGDLVVNVVTNVTGTLMKKGTGTRPGEGTCHSRWYVLEEAGGGTREREATAATAGAFSRVLGSASELLSDLKNACMSVGEARATCACT